jgi:predicted DCC family thiol-disulfide oxidoreductase YuxK
MRRSVLYLPETGSKQANMQRRVEHPPTERPVLLYDGDCTFCRYSVDYLLLVTGDRVGYAPYQQQSGLYPEIPEERCRKSIQFIDTDGRVCEGAQAAFSVMARGGRGSWLACYRWLPGFALVCELLYRLVASLRAPALLACRTLVGELQPLRYQRITSLFLRLLALIYLAAFSSYALQVDGLYGTQGIIPIGDYLRAVDLQGWQRWLSLPTVFWLRHDDLFLLAVPMAGMVASLLLLCRILITPMLFVNWLAYLSLVNAGPVFMQFQWDILLVEAGFIAIVLRFFPGLGLWLYRWLLFRFMWLAGWVKILSGDPMWADRTALSVHFETQPLPTVAAWYAHHLPADLLRWATTATLAIELLIPLLIFMPRRLRLVAFWSFALLQLLILLTGNYNYFNLLTLALCLFLLDDRYLERLLPTRLWPAAADRGPGPAGGRLRLSLAAALAVLILLISMTQLYLIIGRESPHPWQTRLLTITQPFHLANSYGVFAVMTATRPEIIIEGSNDGYTWKPFRFRFKPDELHKAPTHIAPWQPRLDWQLWFASLRPAPPQWFENLLVRLLLGSEPVARLFAERPFGGNPPRYLRALRYRYEFSDPAHRAETGDWWSRTYLDDYRKPMMLYNDNGDRHHGLREIPP